MGSWEFQGNQWLMVEPSDELNPSPFVTVEALCQLLEAGEDPTVLCRPFDEDWEEPYVVWRLGFRGAERKPEFQILFEGDKTPVTVCSEEPIALQEVVHLAGVYGGQSVQLYVDGAVVASRKKDGVPAKSNQGIAIGTRSATDQGGFLVGRLFDLRYWSVARTPEQIDFWKNRTLPSPLTDQGCVGYWQTEPVLPVEFLSSLGQQGFTVQELAFLNFLHAYTYYYSEAAGRLLGPDTRRLYPASVHTALVIKVSDGYLVFYEPDPAEYIANLPLGSSIDVEEGGLVALAPEGSTMSETIQGLTRNAVKVAFPQPSEPRDTGSLFPDDLPSAVDWMVSEDLRADPALMPQIRVLAPRRSTDSQKAVMGNRIRLVAPAVQVEDERVVRAFTWLFADLWIGELDWTYTLKGFAEALAFNDAIAVHEVSGNVRRAAALVQIDSRQPLLPLEKRILEFETLIERDDVDEVRDVLPFLRRPENWFLLSATCEYVWAEKMLGNKWRVDFLVREPGNRYTAVEIESPTKRLYKTGRSVEPYSELNHAEQQVRDYCNFIDRNRDYVEREEGLEGVFKPRGVVVIGRRATLCSAGAKKLEERNADTRRYVIKTFDDLIDEARAMVERIKEIM